MYAPKEIDRELVKRTVEITNKKLKSMWSGIADFDNGEKSKFINPIWERSLVQAAKEQNKDIKMEKGNGWDFKVASDKVEEKGTLTTAAGFVGNKYSSKVPKTIIRKISITNKGINGIFVGTVDLDDCSYKTEKWISVGGSNSGFSRLRFDRDDKDNVNIVCGSLKQNQKWCKEMLEDVENL